MSLKRVYSFASSLAKVVSAISSMTLARVIVVITPKSWAAHETGGASEATWADFETGGANPTTWADLET